MLSNMHGTMFRHSSQQVVLSSPRTLPFCSVLQLAVSADPAAWWRHAIGAVRDECRQVRRKQAPLVTLQRRRELRLRYQTLYAASRAVCNNTHLYSQRSEKSSSQWPHLLDNASCSWCVAGCGTGQPEDDMPSSGIIICWTVAHLTLRVKPLSKCSGCRRSRSPTCAGGSAARLSPPTRPRRRRRPLSRRPSPWSRLHTSGVLNVLSSDAFWQLLRLNGRFPCVAFACSPACSPACKPASTSACFTWERQLARSDERLISHISIFLHQRPLLALRRAGIAAVYCSNLAGSEGAIMRAMVGVDAIIASRGVPSNNVLAMLFPSPKVCSRICRTVDGNPISDHEKWLLSFELMFLTGPSMADASGHPSLCTVPAPQVKRLGYHAAGAQGAAATAGDAASNGIAATRGRGAAAGPRWQGRRAPPGGYAVGCRLLAGGGCGGAPAILHLALTAVYMVSGLEST